MNSNYVRRANTASQDQAQTASFVRLDTTVHRQLISVLQPRFLAPQAHLILTQKAKRLALVSHALLVSTAAIRAWMNQPAIAKRGIFALEATQYQIRRTVSVRLALNARRELPRQLLATAATNIRTRPASLIARLASLASGALTRSPRVVILQRTLLHTTVMIVRETSNSVKRGHTTLLTAQVILMTALTVRRVTSALSSMWKTILLSVAIPTSKRSSSVRKAITVLAVRKRLLNAHLAFTVPSEVQSLFLVKLAITVNRAD